MLGLNTRIWIARGKGCVRRDRIEWAHDESTHQRHQRDELQTSNPTNQPATSELTRITQHTSQLGRQLLTLQIMRWYLIVYITYIREIVEIVVLGVGKVTVHVGCVGGAVGGGGIDWSRHGCSGGGVGLG